MKTKLALLMVGAAITLSFTFISTSGANKDHEVIQPKSSYNEPVGGLVSEDKL